MLDFGGIIRPAYALSGHKVSTTPTNSVISVGRANIVKRPFSLYRYIDERYSAEIITSVKKDDGEEVEYYDKNKHKPHLLDLPHAEVLEKIRTQHATAIMCSCETFGIVALEQLQMGVPILLRIDNHKRHAGTEIAVSSNHYGEFDDKISFKVAVRRLEHVDRKEIQEATLEKHSFENWKRSLSNAFDKTIETHKRNERIILC